MQSERMVKLFVGNLGTNVTSQVLRDLFSQYGQVDECDVIKNYAFVHMSNEQEADAASTRLNNYILDGRELHIEKSTSRLRKAPGMATVCFSCGANDHKTPNCPVDKEKRGRVSPTNGKRGPPRESPYNPPAKRNDHTMSSQPSYYPAPAPVQHGYPPPAPLEYSYQRGPEPYQRPPQHIDYYRPPAQPVVAAAAPPPSGRRSPTEFDPIMPQPKDRDLEPLYKEYVESRERYYYFRARLDKEYALRGATYAQPPPAPTAYSGPPPQEVYARTAPPPQSTVVRYSEYYPGAVPAGGSLTFAPSSAAPQPQYVTYASPGPALHNNHRYGAVKLEH